MPFRPRVDWNCARASPLEKTMAVATTIPAAVHADRETGECGRTILAGVIERLLTSKAKKFRYGLVTWVD
jgi:hypothetical protein